jgi:hypothetical protein
MSRGALLRVAGIVALTLVGLSASGSARAEDDFCVDCLQVRVGPPTVIRGPFPDELDAAFNALKLPDGTFRAFSANGSTYAIDGPSLSEMRGERREVLTAGPKGSRSDCGSWLTSTVRTDGGLLGFVHQEHDCDYAKGKTDKSMAIARSTDDGLTWTDLGTVITGTDAPAPDKITGEGDCTMIDGRDGYLYGYCLRNTDWQTIAVRAPIDKPTEWHKFYEGGWTEPGLGGKATAIGFVGIGTGYLKEPGWVAAVATDPWFGGLRLSLSKDKATFADLKEPLLPIDGSDWHRPAATDLIAYTTVLNPEDGSNAIDWHFLLAYIYVPINKGFESRYLVYHEVSVTPLDAPQSVQVGAALTRWSDGGSFVTSTGPLTGDRERFKRDAVVAYVLTREPEGTASHKIAECSSESSGRLDQVLAEDGGCEAEGYVRERISGWLYADVQPGTVPVYRCRSEAGAHFASNTDDCEGLGSNESLLGYGLSP